MIVMLSAASLVLGAASAYAAERFPAHVKLLESGGGALLVTGLALLGSALPHA
jgi:hypothetical protein